MSLEITDFAIRTKLAYAEWIHDKPTMLAVDTETTGVAFYDTPFCATIAWDRDDGDITSHYFELGVADTVLKEILNETPELIFHNAKFDLQKLNLVQLLIARNPLTVHDTEALAHLLDEHRPKKLKTLAKELLGEETNEAEEIKRVRKEHKLRASDGYDKLPRESIVPYALKDAEYTLQLWQTLYPQITKFNDLLELYEREQRLTFVLLAMEAKGMALDLEYVETTSKSYASASLFKEIEIRDITGDEDFNPNSPKQVTEAFAKLGIELEGTGKEVLNEISHPLAEKILELRTLNKMHSTYLKPMLHEQRNGIIHPSFRQHGTVTGRMSSGKQEDV